jgi:hypothetical protein
MTVTWEIERRHSARGLWLQCNSATDINRHRVDKSCLLDREINSSHPKARFDVCLERLLGNCEDVSGLVVPEECYKSQASVTSGFDRKRDLFRRACLDINRSNLFQSTRHSNVVQCSATILSANYAGLAPFISKRDVQRCSYFVESVKEFPAVGLRVGNWNTLRM